MDFSELMKTRRSCREMQQKSVEEDKINMILEAARLSQSASNRQPRKIVVVTDEDVLRELAAACYDQPATKNAPVMFAVCSDLTHVMACGQPCAPMDCAIACSNMLNQAAELGVFGCWLGRFDQEAVKKVINAPEGYTVYAVIPMGYPAAELRARPRKSMEEIVIRKRW